jgi:hypothetical protein
MQPIIIHRALLSDPTSCGAEQPFPERFRFDLPLLFD